MADFSFDGTTKIIKEPAGSGNTTFLVGRDLYSAWKRWVQSGNGEFDAAFTVEGGTPIGATGLFTGTTFLLVNGWKVMAADHNHQVTLSGNLFSDDGIVSVANPVGQITINVSASVNAQGVSTSGGGGLTATQAQQLADIWDKLPSDGEEIAGENDVSPGGGSSPWSTAEKDQLILDMEITKRQATKAVNNTEKET